jgi:hypothetical protein
MQFYPISLLRRGRVVQSLLMMEIFRCKYFSSIFRFWKMGEKQEGVLCGQNVAPDGCQENNLYRFAALSRRGAIKLEKNIQYRPHSWEGLGKLIWQCI